MHILFTVTLQEWSLLLHQTEAKLLDPLGSEFIDNISTLERNLQVHSIGILYYFTIKLGGKMSKIKL